MGGMKDFIEEYNQLNCPECGVQPWLTRNIVLDESMDQHTWMPDAGKENTDWEALPFRVKTGEVEVSWDHDVVTCLIRSMDNHEAREWNEHLIDQWLQGRGVVTRCVDCGTDTVLNEANRCLPCHDALG